MTRKPWWSSSRRARTTTGRRKRPGARPTRTSARRSSSTPFLADFKRARQLPRLENDFKRYRLNIWTEQAVKWLPIDQVDEEDGHRYGWDHCIGPIAWNDPRYEAELVGKRCFGGLDLSAIIDLSALAWWFPGAGRPRRSAPADPILEAKRAPQGTRQA
jgi:phage terminase large subunit-like protein